MMKIFTCMIPWILAVLLVGCQPSPPPSTKPCVLVSVAPYAYVVKKLASDFVEIETLVPEGANPHIYEAPPKQVAKHKHAALWIYLGEGFDRKMALFLKEHQTTVQTLDLTTGIELLHAEEGCTLHAAHAEGKDLHLWMSPRLLQMQAKNISEALVTILPEHKQQIQERLSSLLEELALLDQTISQLLLPKQGSHILVSHPAFAYFCKDYGLHQLSVEVEGKEPKPQDIDHLLFHAKEHDIHIVITEPQHSNKGAEAIASLLGLSSEMIDPYTENYPETLLHLAKIIAQ